MERATNAAFLRLRANCVALSVHVRILHLYRPTLPSTRAQTVQVIHTCHALARRGHDVTLLADVDAEAPLASVQAALETYGLDQPPFFDLRLAPTAWKPAASLWFRAQVRAWTRAATPDSVVYAREKRYVSLLPPDVPLVFEAHDVAVEMERESGHDPAPAYAEESAVFRRAAGLVANCGGTMALIESTYDDLPPCRRVVHNATRLDRAVQRHPAAFPLVGYTGSPRPFKGLDTVFASLPLWPARAALEMVGGGPDNVPAGVNVIPSVAYGELPEWLARYHAVLLPLDDNLFGRALTSPLKLWDYLATGIPIVAADLPTVREIGGDTLHYYMPRNPRSLADAVAEALAAGASPRRVRTWDHRATELERFLHTVLAKPA